MELLATSNNTFTFNKDDDKDKIVLNVDIQHFFSPDTNAKHAVDNALIELSAFIIASYFVCDNLRKHLEQLFKTEGVTERLFFVHSHAVYVKNILGSDPKLLYDDWVKGITSDKNKMIRSVPVTFQTFATGEEKSQNKDKKMDLNSIRHDRMRVNSIIEIPLWNEANWKGTGFFITRDFIVLTLCFINIDRGKTIFENWKKRIGNVDTTEEIEVHIVKGIDKKHPAWYRVVITARYDNKHFKSEEIIFSSARINEMNPDDTKNIDAFEKEYSRRGKYIFCPGEGINNSIPDLKLGIIKSKIKIRYAWQIGINDPVCIAIYKDDEPVIPDDIKDAPVIELLKKINEEYH